MAIVLLARAKGELGGRRDTFTNTHTHTHTHKGYLGLMMRRTTTCRAS